MNHRVAHCCCTQLSVTCQGEPLSVSACNCKQCQRRTGGYFGVAAFYPETKVQIFGHSTAYTRPSDSGYDVTFHFCPDCGSTVFWRPARKPDVIAIAPGAFADPDFPPPTQSVFERHRHGWLELPVPTRSD